jgi:hypothetical protein
MVSSHFRLISMWLEQSHTEVNKQLNNLKALEDSEMQELKAFSDIIIVVEKRLL